MDFSQDERNPGKKFTGIAVVILLHVLIIYALVSGLARKMVEVIAKPVETKIIEEVAPPPPPPDTPPPPPPKMMAPPPPFIPPPEVQVQQPQAPTITALTNVAPEKPTPFQRPVIPPGMEGVHSPAIVDVNSCKPDYPAKSLRDEETGVTALAFLIGTDGHVVESRIEKSSGFKGLDNAARNALSLCKFKVGTVDGKPEQSWMKLQYVWKLD